MRPRTTRELDSGTRNSVYRVDTNKKRSSSEDLLCDGQGAVHAGLPHSVVDEAVGAAGLGPQIHVRTDDALVAEFVTARL